MVSRLLIYTRHISKTSNVPSSSPTPPIWPILTNTLSTLNSHMSILTRLVTVLLSRNYSRPFTHSATPVRTINILHIHVCMSTTKVYSIIKAFVAQLLFAFKHTEILIIFTDLNARAYLARYLPLLDRPFSVVGCSR